MCTLGIEATETEKSPEHLRCEQCLEGPKISERDPAGGEAPGCFGLFHATSDICVDCPMAARCLARRHLVHIRLGKTANTSGQTIRPHRRPRCWLPPVVTCLTAEHKGNHYEAVVVEYPDIPLGRAIFPRLALAVLEFILQPSSFRLSECVATHRHNTGLTFWQWNRKNNCAG